MLKGMFLSVERRRQDRRETKNVYTFGACEKRGQCDACCRKGWDSWQDTVAKIVGKGGADRWNGGRCRHGRGEGTGGTVG